MELALISGLTYLGYHLNKDGRPVTKKIDNKLVTKNEKPSGDNIYQSRFMETAWDDAFRRSSANYRASTQPLKTGVVNGATYKTYQNNKYEKRIYNKSDRVVQQEKDINRAEPDTTTMIPSSTLNQFDTTYSLIDAKTVTDIGTKTFNEKRNNIPNPEFEAYPTGDGQPIYRTVYSGKEQTGKGVNVYEKGHNNMEPFFGSSIKQNTRSDANRTLLENHTGTNPVFKHKKEVKRLFPVTKNPYAVGGMPVANNREVDRYIPSIKKQNILPFEQKRVAPGLNRSMTDTTTNIGFHETYRPFGEGSYKPINELRVNPKLTYKGRIAGEKYFITKQEKARPVISRQPVDLSYTTFTPNQSESFGNVNNSELTNNYKYRQNISDSAQVKKGQIISQDSIILKNTDRQDYAAKIADLPGHSRDQNQRGQTYSWDNARTTVKQQTARHKHSHINTQAEVNKNIVNPYDNARFTIRQETEDHKHSHINRGDGDRRGQTYSWDDAKGTIKQQTENHEHSHINRGDGDRRGQTYSWDDARTTVKEQTHVEDYVGTQGSSQSRTQVNRTNYHNAEINGLKELSLKGRKPTQKGATAIGGKHLYNIDVRKTQFKTIDNTHRVAAVGVPTLARHQIGSITKQKPNYADKDILQSRINPLFTEQHRKNPYTQSLTSYSNVFNPAYPRK